MATSRLERIGTIFSSEMSNLKRTVEKEITINSSISKKKKICDDVELSGESRQKIINTMDGQFQTRKQINENLLKGLLEIITDMEGDYTALQENVQKLQHLTGSFLKCMQQTITAHKNKLSAFKEIHSTFKKESEEASHKIEIYKLGEDLEVAMNKFKEKLIADTKRHGWETLQRSFMQAMENDI